MQTLYTLKFVFSLRTVRQWVVIETKPNIYLNNSGTHYMLSYCCLWNWFFKRLTKKRKRITYLVLVTIFGFWEINKIEDEFDAAITFISILFPIIIIIVLEHWKCCCWIFQSIQIFSNVFNRQIILLITFSLFHCNTSALQISNWSDLFLTVDNF